jgi:hypothetical protein
MSGLLDTFGKRIAFINDLYGVGGLVYAFWVVITSAPVIYAVITTLRYLGIENTPPRLVIIVTVSIALGCAVAFRQFRRWHAREQLRRDRMWNPDVFIEEETIVCDIDAAKGCERIDTIVMRARRRGVAHYIFSVGKTAAEGITLHMIEGGTFSINNEYADRTQYTVDLGCKLKKNQPWTIKCRWEVKDLTKAPYLKRTMNSPFDKVTFQINFAKKLIAGPVSVYTASPSGVPMDGMEKLPLRNHPTDAGKEYVIWNVGRGTKHPPIIESRYVLQWEWR